MAGHAFHAFAVADLPYHFQHQTPMEFNEVASMSMELLAAPYLASNGSAGEPNGSSFYNPADAARARIEHLKEMILFWPYMAVIDAFQHWVYTHLDTAVDPAACDACWSELWDRYMPGGRRPGDIVGCRIHVSMNSNFYLHEIGSLPTEVIVVPN